SSPGVRRAAAPGRAAPPPGALVPAAGADAGADAPRLRDVDGRDHPVRPLPRTGVPTQPGVAAVLGTRGRAAGEVRGAPARVGRSSRPGGDPALLRGGSGRQRAVECVDRAAGMVVHLLPAPLPRRPLLDSPGRA